MIATESSKVKAWLDELGIELGGCHRVIVDIVANDVVKVYVTRYASDRAFDIRFNAGEFEIVEVDATLP